MTVLELDAASTAGIRSAVSPVSPVHELLGWLRLASTRRRHPTLEDVGAT